MQSLPTRSFLSSGRSYRCLDLEALAGADAAALPFSLKVLLENHLRAFGPDSPDGLGEAGTAAGLLGLAGRVADAPVPVALKATRVVLPDSSGLPLLMDLAALRGRIARVPGADPARVQPLIPLDLVVDHSLTVTVAGRPDAMALNMRREFEQNAERYRFFKWAQGAFDNLRVVPPGMGIIHQVHLERLARVVATEEGPGEEPDGTLVFPEFVLGCDSHTPTINALGILAARDVARWRCLGDNISYGVDQVTRLHVRQRGFEQPVQRSEGGVTGRQVGHDRYLRGFT